MNLTGSVGASGTTTVTTGALAISGALTGGDVTLASSDIAIGADASVFGNQVTFANNSGGQMFVGDGTGAPGSGAYLLDGSEIARVHTAGLSIEAPAVAASAGGSPSGAALVAHASTAAESRYAVSPPSVSCLPLAQLSASSVCPAPRVSSATTASSHDNTSDAQRAACASFFRSKIAAALSVALIADNGMVTVPVAVKRSDESDVAMVTYRRWLIDPTTVVVDIWRDA